MTRVDGNANRHRTDTELTLTELTLTAHMMLQLNGDDAHCTMPLFAGKRHFDFEHPPAIVLIS